jgi:hypothetical protein
MNNVLEFKFGLKCSIHKLSSIGRKPRIYIWQESSPWGDDSSPPPVRGRGRIYD